MTPRDKALNTILSLRRLAEHANTPPHEAEAARGRIKALQIKHGITTASEQAKAKPKHDPNVDEWIKWAQDVAAQTARADHAARVKAARDGEAIRKRKAQEEWERKHANSDAMGRPRTEAEQKEAQRDPLSWAAKQDKRTHNQKQADLNAAMGKQGTQPKCAKPETFFDQGGIARKRNTFIMTCDRCDTRLYPGDGTIMNLGGKWFGRCCESKPGPRAKKQR